MAKIMASILSKHTVSSCLQVIHSAGARGFDEKQVFRDGNRVRIFRGRANAKLLVIGWNINLQSSFGVSNAEIEMIGTQLSRTANG